ncbi:hypothetical protein M427DRAFT_155259 [Gonapodya prolifera JEL478]|uniref:Potassium channel tetramerisation-type BTB domain-containing protein n=1 Tax=Gonapodya prolifera (strain JEL478) TaxID=1344416 RepID=A0A139AGF7_GONPJ|nr:hypothetical protein M427DRAFT_155259 [Gonapodya prolifera JEL478]|eukprot:KXS15525.1 hypothetical protein M427DRAFT_155259 [Gonapodya prolifera JEL478]
MSISHFNIGGRPFAISLSLVSRFPDSHLARLASHPTSLSGPPGVFLDHNPAAVEVVLDYLRYGELMVPPSVSDAAVGRVARDLLGFDITADRVGAGAGAGAQRNDSIAAAGGSSVKAALDEDRPPEYGSVFGSGGFSGYSGASKDVKRPLNALNDEMNVTLESRLDALVEDIVPLALSHARMGHNEVEFFLSDLPTNPSLPVATSSSSYVTLSAPTATDEFLPRNSSAAVEWVHLDPNAGFTARHPTLQVIMRPEVMAKLEVKVAQKIGTDGTGASPGVYLRTQKSGSSVSESGPSTTRQPSGSSSRLGDVLRSTSHGYTSTLVGPTSPAAQRATSPPTAPPPRARPVEAEVRHGAVRKENEFGLVETRTVDVLVVRVKLV